MVTITRKIQLVFHTDDNKKRREYFDTLVAWQKICHKAANLIATHQYLQQAVKDMIYLTEEVKVRLADIKTDNNGILTTSKQNSSYRVLSAKFKGEIPMGILASLNSNVVLNFNSESLDVLKGKRSLRSYKKDIPMPVRAADIRHFGVAERSNGNYSFQLYGIPFLTNFGRDRSYNNIIVDRFLAGEYKLCDSSIAIEQSKKGLKNKIFLLATFQFEPDKVQLDPGKICYAELDLQVPIKGQIGKFSFEIGSENEFLYRRVAIQANLRNIQKACRFNLGGRGRKKKMKTIEQFRKMEQNYVNTRIHTYTSMLVKYCIRNKCGVLVLVDQEEKETTAKLEENKAFLLRNWGYFGMKDKLGYKCLKAGIEIKIVSKKDL